MLMPFAAPLMPAFAKDAGWQWYNEKLKPHDEERKAAPAAPPPQMDILEKLATLQAATKRSLCKPFCIHRLKTSLSISGCRTTGRSRQFVLDECEESDAGKP
jgi:hypothetical protein